MDNDMRSRFARGLAADAVADHEQSHDFITVKGILVSQRPPADVGKTGVREVLHGDRTSQTS